MSIGIGTQLGSHEVTGLLGKGGMGEVYRAKDTRLKRDVALKLLPDDFASDPDRLLRFQREAEVLASLNHPNIAQVYGLEQSGDTQFIVMELVEGDTLEARLRRGAIPIDEALPAAKEIAEALEAAHERNVIHRDLKPGNIKVTPDGKVKVLDFGLAKTFHRDEATNLSNSPTLMSASLPGMILGTAAYMAPEQAKGGAVDQRTDVFAFGCVLYEMLTGHQAFQGDSVSEILASVLKSDANLSLLPPRLNPRLLDLLRRCLEKNPRNRWHAAADLRLELQSIINAGHSMPRDQPASRSSLSKPVFLAFAMGMVLAAVLGFAIWQWRPSSAPVTVARFAIPIPEVQQTAFVRRNMAISPDGSQVVYEANRRLYLRSISESEAKPIAGSEDSIAATSPTFSPDGRGIAFYAAGERNLKTIPVTGGAASSIAAVDQLGIYGISWGRQGIVFGQGLSSIVEVPEKGGEPRVLIKAANSEYVSFPEALPDGNAILFSKSDGTLTRLVVQSRTTGEPKVLAETKDNGALIGHYVPTGHIVYVSGGVLLAIPFNLQKLEATGTSVSMIQGVRQTSVQEPMLSISETGSLIYMAGPIGDSGGALNLAISDRNGTLDRLNLPKRNYQTPRLSPDGKRVAFGIEEGTEASIWTYDLSGASGMSRLTFGGKNRFPVWSQNGERIAFQSDRDGDLAIFSQRSDGNGVAERLTRPDKGVSHVAESWSPNGETLLFRATQGDSKVSLWALSIREKTAMPFGRVQSAVPTNAVFSPDGRWVAYHALEPGKALHEVYVQPFPATGSVSQLPISRDNHHPAWSRDGKELFYIPGPGEYASVSFTSTAGVAFGNPVPVRGSVNTAPPATPRQYDITADGKLIGQVVSEQTQTGTPATPQITIILNWFEELKQRVPVK